MLVARGVRHPMRIAFVSGNQEKLPDAVVPLGLLYVMASTPEHHERTLIDLCFERALCAPTGRARGENLGRDRGAVP